MTNFQSGFHANHANSHLPLIKVLLDHSAAFDTVDHNILLQTGTLAWIFMYSYQVAQIILTSCQNYISTPTSLTCGVPLGLTLYYSTFIWSCLYNLLKTIRFVIIAMLMTPNYIALSPNNMDTPNLFVNLSNRGRSICQLRPSAMEHTAYRHQGSQLA